MSESLLTKVRRLNKIIEASGPNPLEIPRLSCELGEALDSNIYIVNSGGQILGYTLTHYDLLDRWEIKMGEEPSISSKYKDKLLKINKTIANEDALTFLSMDSNPLAIIPINNGGQRLGTLIMDRFEDGYGNEDLILAEYNATIIGMEIINVKAQQLELEMREKAIVQMAMRTLSYSELEAIEHIMRELDGQEGLLVASKIADKVGITRSIIVNALRKLESAGIIESRSLGMKGTHIRILNKRLLDELERNR